MISESNDHFNFFNESLFMDNQSVFLLSGKNFRKYSHFLMDELMMIHFDDSKIGKMLVKGNYGCVYEYHEDFEGKRLCVKIVYKHNLTGFQDDKLQIYFDREYKNLLKLDHPNIVSIFSVDEREDVCYFFMEKIEGITMDKIIDNQKQKKKRIYFLVLLPLFKQLVSALRHCHQNKILLRDLNPSNIMISPDMKKATVVDFGLSYDLESLENPCSSRGCVCYWSPETFSSNQYSYSADIWSLGLAFLSVCHSSFSFRREERET